MKEFLVQDVEFTVTSLVREDTITAAIHLNNAFYLGICENYSMNGSFRLKNEEKCKHSGWMVAPVCSRERTSGPRSADTQGWRNRLQSGIWSIDRLAAQSTESCPIGSIGRLSLGHFGSRILTLCI